MKRIVGCLGLITALVLGIWAFSAAAQEQEIKTVTLRAWTIGPDLPSVTRKLNLEAAVERLNKYLKAAGANVQVEIEATFHTGTWDDYKRANLLALQTGDPTKIPDIIFTCHDDVAPYAEAGYLTCLDEYVAKYPEVYEDFFSYLWDACRYKGKIWAIPQDTEARVFYYRKDLLREAGYSDEFIESIPDRVVKGEFTLNDIVDVGQRLLESGVVEKEHAIWHRPTIGVDWLQFIRAFGGEIYDPETGKLVVDRSATLAFFRFMKQLVDLGLTPRAMTQIAWPELFTAFVKGQVGIYLAAGSWQWAEMQGYGATEEFLWENVGFAPIPAGEKGGRPVSFSRPGVWLIPSASQHKDLAFLVITLASSVDLATRHAIKSGHLAIRHSQLSYVPYAENKFLKTVSELCAPFGGISPNHPQATVYWDVLYKDGFVPVETGVMTPEQALEHFIRRMKDRLGDEVIVRD